MTNVDQWLLIAKPKAIQGKFMWSCADSFSEPIPDHIPVQLVFSREFRGESFPVVYDTEEEAMSALHAGVERWRAAA